MQVQYAPDVHIPVGGICRHPDQRRAFAQTFDCVGFKTGVGNQAQVALNIRKQTASESSSGLRYCGSANTLRLASVLHRKAQRPW